MYSLQTYFLVGHHMYLFHISETTNRSVSLITSYFRQFYSQTDVIGQFYIEKVLFIVQCMRCIVLEKKTIEEFYCGKKRGEMSTHVQIRTWLGRPRLPLLWQQPRIKSLKCTRHSIRSLLCIIGHKF